METSTFQMKTQMEQSLSKDIIFREIGAVHSIYFDLAMLQDVYIGALLLHTHNEKEYNHILAGIPYYQARIDKDICKYFPETTLTDETLFQFLADPTHAEDLAKISPHTNLWMELKDIMGIFINNNRVVDEDGFHCDILINLYPVQYPPIVCKTISRALKQISDNLTLKTVCMPFTELPISVRLTPDVYFLEDNSVLMSSESPIRDEIYVQNYYDNKHIFAKRVITSDNLHTDLKTMFDKTKYLCNIFTQFEYVDIYIPGVEYVPPVVNEPDPATKHKVALSK